MRIFLFTLLSLFLIQNLSQAQGIAIGEWRDHLPYGNTNKIAVTPDRIYASTPYNVFYYDLGDNSINRLSTINGLSDIGVSSIAYNKDYDILVITYTNTNIDLIKHQSIVNVLQFSSYTLIL